MARPLPEPSVASFTLPGARANVLALHGFTSTPYELRGVADALAAIGVGTVAPLLPGHGTNPADLMTVSAEDWLDAANAAYEKLDRTRPRFLLGASMGGLLAILLAAERDVTAVALLAPALQMQPSGELGALLARGGLSRLYPLVEKAEPGGDTGCPEGRAKNPTYTHMATHGIAELGRLRDRARAQLPKLHAPTLTVHGRQDRTISPASSGEVLERAGGVVERVTLPRSRHILGLDVERDEVSALVCRFFEQALAEREG